MSLKRRELSDVNRRMLSDRIRDAIDTAAARPRDAVAEPKQIQTDIKSVTLVTDDRRELSDLLHRAWGTVKDGFRRRDADYADRLSTPKRSPKPYRDRLVAEIERLEDQIDHAWSDAWRQDAEARLDQKRNKLREEEGRVAEIAGKLASVHNRI